jgi:hypothetical protein
VICRSISCFGRCGRRGADSSSESRFGGSWGSLGTVIKLVR